VAHDGNWTERLYQVDFGSQGCRYFGAPERPGIYSVVASGAAGTATVTGISAVEQGCHVQRREVTLTLAP
jgi:hypothetical protein